MCSRRIPGSVSCRRACPAPIGCSLTCSARNKFMLPRRDFLRRAGIAAASQVVVRAADVGAIAVDPKPLFEISPWLYMQFMEPLGATDSSVEACWDYDADDWR